MSARDGGEGGVTVTTWSKNSDADVLCTCPQEQFLASNHAKAEAGMAALTSYLNACTAAP